MFWNSVRWTKRHIVDKKCSPTGSKSTTYMSDAKILLVDVIIEDVYAWYYGKTVQKNIIQWQHRYSNKIHNPWCFRFFHIHFYFTLLLFKFALLFPSILALLGCGIISLSFNTVHTHQQYSTCETSLTFHSLLSCCCRSRLQLQKIYYFFFKTVSICNRRKTKSLLIKILGCFALSCFSLCWRHRSLFSEKEDGESSVSRVREALCERGIAQEASCLPSRDIPVVEFPQDVAMFGLSGCFHPRIR